MNFETTPNDFLQFLPTYLTSEEKGRLNQALEQFKEERGKVWSQKTNSHFYSQRKFDYFQQGDLLCQIRYPAWNKQDKIFDKVYVNALVLSNTCDLDISNDRNITKEVVLAPITEYTQYIKKLAFRLGKETLPIALEESIKAQTYSSLFYLPQTPINPTDYVCHLDKAFWFPTEELHSYLPDIEQTRISSLDYFGYYLFLVKLSYHFCRLPEEKQR
jgi:hypothetical protein